MAKFSGKEKDRLTFCQKESKQRVTREERARRVAAGTYRPRSTVFTDKRRKSVEKAERREVCVDTWA